jgi:hypothetical protein
MYFLKVPPETSIAYAAALAGVSDVTVHAWIRRRVLTSLGKPAKIRVADLEKHLGRRIGVTELNDAAERLQSKGHRNERSGKV